MMKKTLISILQKIHKIVTKHFFFSDSRIEEAGSLGTSE